MQMYYVYILKSSRFKRICIGSTQNVESRVLLHNQGKVRSTKAYRPWSVLEQHEYSTRSEALKAEYFYKSGQQRELIKQRHSL